MRPSPRPARRLSAGTRATRFFIVLRTIQNDKARRLLGDGFRLMPGYPVFIDFWILAQVSRRVTVRLKTGLPGAEYLVSTQK